MDLLRPAVAFLGLAAAAILGGANQLEGQLLSPGPLIEAHETLEGALQCTQCHQLRQRGAAAPKCLACHAPLRARIDLGRGFHGQIDASDCGECHTDHAGRDADVVRFDAAEFDHREAGFALLGTHANLECTSCHTSERIVDREVRRQKAAGGHLSKTFLGLSATCLGCHRTEDPHGAQFGTDACETCHTNAVWSDLAPFDHAETAYPLTGAHRNADCAGCHTVEAESAVLYRDLPAGDCGSCHGDPHRRAFGNQCSSCHSTNGWSGVSSGRVERSFNHRATGFPLRGAHDQADCASCHTAAAEGDRVADGLSMRWEQSSSTGFAPPVVDQGCLSCHLDYHEGDLAEAQDGPDCGGCHTELGWSPSAFDFSMHQRTEFPLEGAHQAVLCEACHTVPTQAGLDSPRMTFEVAWTDCGSCHAQTDPHRGQFGNEDCGSCHTAESFRIPNFDHASTRFPLDETHQLPCATCHVPAGDGPDSFVRFAPLGTRCQDCHT